MPTDGQTRFVLCLLTSIMGGGVPTEDAAVIVDGFLQKMAHVRVTVPDPGGYPHAKKNERR